MILFESQSISYHTRISLRLLVVSQVLAGGGHERELLQMVTLYTYIQCYAISYQLPQARSRRRKRLKPERVFSRTVGERGDKLPTLQAARQF